MEQRVKRSTKFLSLVSKFETTLRSGHTNYFDERTFSALIDYYISIDQPKLAYKAVENALVQYPFRSDFYIVKIRLLIAEGSTTDALDVIYHTEDIHPGDVEVQLLKAQCLAKLKSFSEAFEIIDELRDYCFNQDLIEVLFCEASIYEIQKDFRSAYEKLKELLEIYPLHVEALERIWLCVEMTKGYEDSIEFHQALLDDEVFNSLAWYNLGHALACVGKYGEAIDALEYSFLINKSFLLGHHDCAELCMETRKYKRALGIFQEILENFGLDCEVLVKVGICYIHLNDFDKAFKILTKAVKLDMYYDEGLFYLAECYRYFEKYDKAIFYYQKAIELEDRREEYFASLAITYSLIADYTKAHYYFRKATEIGPEDDRLWVAHATFLHQIGEKDKALEVLEEADMHSVGSNLDYCRAASLISSLKNREAGIALLNNALSEDFGEYKTLFDFDPSLKADSQITSMIKYYSGS